MGVPDNKPIKAVINGIVDKLSLPTIDKDGNPIGYIISKKGLEKTLDGAKTLKSEGIKEGITLFLIVKPPDVGQFQSKKRNKLYSEKEIRNISIPFIVKKNDDGNEETCEHELEVASTIHIVLYIAN